MEAHAFRRCWAPSQKWFVTGHDLESCKKPINPSALAPYCSGSGCAATGVGLVVMLDNTSALSSRV